MLPPIIKHKVKEEQTILNIPTPLHLPYSPALMQGDIIQLDQEALRGQTSGNLELRPRMTALEGESLAPAQVAIYNEDDLSHLLYVDVDHADAYTAGRETKFHVGHVGHVGQHDYSVFPEHQHGTHTPLSETDESAVLSDCESEDDDDDALPRSPTRPRGGSICSETFEPPVFGRQAGSTTSTAPPSRSASQSSSGYGPGLNWKSDGIKHVQVVLPEDHVSKIEGPLMSWWPESLGSMEHEWIEMKEQDESVIPEKQHVSKINGPLMSLWPLPLEMMQYDWNERFYE